MGVCESSGLEPFATAGPHWNPTGEMHGAPDAMHHHAGDFGNFTAGDDGVGEADITTKDSTLAAGRRPSPMRMGQPSSSTLARTTSSPSRPATAAPATPVGW